VSSVLDPDELRAATASLNEATGMPAAFYTSPELFALEREHILLRRWIFLCRDEMLPNAGDYRAFDTAGGPLVLVRSADGVLRAFANVCRHRGSILVDGEGSVRRFVCPYHAWSYTLDGALAACPDMERAVDFDRADNGLTAVRLEQWNGFVFVNFDDEAAGLLSDLGDLPDRLASHRLDRMRCTWRITLTNACNWKLILENAMETYHTGILHRDTVGKQESRTVATFGDWRCIQVISGRSIATLPGTPPPFPTIDGLDDDARRGTYFTVLQPACQFAVAQDCMWWLNVTPIAVDRTMLEVGGCFPEDVVASAGFAEKAAPYYDRWEQVAREDVGILERQQRALGSVTFRPGRLSWRDDEVQALGMWVLDQLPLGT
jgi:phenylpropionate dioxygenase-like ring-hydroxylating dioxygenase large terminal subunit